MMQDTLIIDTTGGIETQMVAVEPLPLYDENHSMLKVPIPEYKKDLPNPLMELLVKRLKMTMKKYGGIGLSANQCGVFERVFIIGTDDFQMACINPKIISASPEQAKSEEGCLSFPGLSLKIDRPTSIQVEYLNENGQVVQTQLDGMTARCFQHELDHMNGIRFVEHVRPVALQMAKKKQDKLMKKVIRRKNYGLPF
jgi:peptide deformylase